jgi:glycerate 2-kinase
VTLREDAEAISSRWMADLNLASLIVSRLDDSSRLEGSVDVVAIGKASREMARAARSALGQRVHRTLVISDVGHQSETSGERVLIGEHPTPGPGSLRAGEELTTFLESEGHAGSALFLLSGGASSLCVLSAPPLTVDDLSEIWRAALRTGIDITALNKIRATTSLLAGGALLRHVRSTHSKSLILVDNVVSGAQWVASAMTYDYRPSREEVEELWASIDLDATLRARMLRAFESRSRLMDVPPGLVHENVVVGEPSMMLPSMIEEAARRGYRVIDMGAHVIGDVEMVARKWGNAMRNVDTRTVVVGVGEVTVQVEGGGQGGRCQEFAWLMAKELRDCARPSVFVARASDGRDYLEGVGGAWVSESTMGSIAELGLDWRIVTRTHDTYPALHALGQLIEGGHTGWNLCDVYVAVID